MIEKIIFRSNIVGENVFYSPNFEASLKEGEGLDMAIMATCNHTIISHGKRWAWLS